MIKLKDILTEASPYKTASRNELALYISQLSNTIKGTKDRKMLNMLKKDKKEVEKELKSRKTNEGKLTEGISVADERHVGKFLIVILSSGSEMRSAILSKKNNSKYGTRDKKDLKTLWDLAGKYKGKEIKEGKLKEAISHTDMRILYVPKKDFKKSQKLLKMNIMRGQVEVEKKPSSKVKGFYRFITTKKLFDEVVEWLAEAGVGVKTISQGKM